MRKYLIWISILAVMLTAAPKGYTYEPVVYKEVLESNGLPVLVQEMPGNPMVSVYMLVKTGSATEGKYLGVGLSHFLEHMLFKGTERRGVGEISAEIQAVGGNLNASTGWDFTIYTINVPYDEFDVGLDVLADMIMNSTLDPVEVDKEREVVYNEMRLHRDNPSRYLNEIAIATMYKTHPYQHPVIGYKDLLEQVTRDEMMDYYKSKYIPNNMVFVAAGNIKTEEVMPKIREAFKDFKRRPYLKRTLPQEPDQILPRRTDEKFETNLTHLMVLYPSVSLLDRDLYALDVLAQILGQGKSSRLYTDLYKKQQIVDSIGAGNYTPVDMGAFEVWANLSDESNLDKVLEEIDKHIQRVKENGVTADELKKAKKQVLSSYIFGNQTTQRVAWKLAYDEAFTGDYNFSVKYTEAVNQVTNEDIKRLARKYLTDQTRNVVVLHPKDSTFDAQTAGQDFAGQAIQKQQLANGMTLLTREDPMFELVSIRLNLRGGIYEETPDNNGLSALTASTWIKGSESMDAEEIARFTDSRGMSLSHSSGKNSFGIALDCLSEDWKVCLDLLSDFVRTPTFPQAEIDLIKQQHVVALKQREKSIFQLAFYNLKKTLYPGHPLGLDPLGTEESLAAVDRADIVDFYRRLVVPGNMILSVFGDIDTDEVRNYVNDSLGQLEAADVAIASAPDRPLDEAQLVDLPLEKTQAMVLFGFPAVDFKHPDYYKLRVMSEILGSPFSGRLFTKIRDQEGKAYTMGGNVAPSVDAGYVYFYVLTDPQHVETVDGLIRAEIERIKTEPVGDTEMNNIKRYIKGSHKSGLQTNSQLGTQSNLNELYGLGYDYHEQHAEQIDAITVEDVQNVANKYLDLDKFVTVYVRPTVKE